MKTIKFTFIVGWIALIGLTACGFNISNLGAVTRVTGSGKVATESRNVSGFNGLIVNGAGKVSIDRTGSESLAITTDDNLLQYIVTEVRGGKLVIEFKPNIVTDRVADLSFTLTVKDLNSIEINGAAVVDGKNLQADQLSVTVSGAGATKLAGKADQLTVTLNGAGAHNSENLESKRATVTNNGAGAATVRVSDSLNANIAGIGMIEYIGNPQVTKNVAGIGVVRQR
ncbi:MAG: DUF2807 domain-containing protein [Chloroflexi bacterium]|nr:DUF2807 domain-containing protein [Chloroflexota bacterium]